MHGTALLVPDRPAQRQARPGPTSDALARAGEIGGELLLIFGTRDPHTPAGRPRDRPRGAGRGRHALQWHEYDAEHAFGRDIGPRFDPEATDRAFAETVAFFRRVL